MGKLKFSNKSETVKSQTNSEGWIDTINAADKAIGATPWLTNLMALLPYQEHTNLVFDLDELKKMDMAKQSGEEVKEKVYAYACFVPPGRFNSCILYNTENQSKSQKHKSLYTMLIKAKAREHSIDIKHKKVKQYRAERRFFQESSIFKDWVMPDYRKMLETDLEYSKIGGSGNKDTK